MKRFKQLPAGSRFTHEGKAYRKAGSRSAYLIGENGRGQTHAAVTFCRNTWVTKEAAK